MPMASEPILQRLAAEFDSPDSQIRAVVALLEEGAPPHFIRRYRRDEVGDLGEERIFAIEERWHFLADLESRKAAIVQQATERGGLTDELKATLEECFDQDQLDDIYQSFRPRRRTTGQQAEEKGLLPLALALRHGTVAEATLLEAVQPYVAAEKDLPTPESVIEGVGAILAESFANDPRLRARVRDELSRGILRATASAPTRKDAQRYKEFFDFAEPVRKIPAGRMLALRRAEREGILTLQLTLPEGRELELFRERFAPDVDRETERGRFLDEVFKIAYSQLVRPACEADIRRRLKEKADKETIRGFLRGLSAQLLAPPLGPKKVLAIRASRQNIWLAVLGEDGSIAQHRTITVRAEKPAPQQESAAKPPDAAAQPREGAAPAEAPSEAAASEAPVVGSNPESTPAAETAAPEAAAEAQEAEATPPSGPAISREEAVAMIAQILQSESPAGIAVPHGRRLETTSAFVRDALALCPGLQPVILAMDETTAAIYATSPAGRKELHGVDVGIRTAVSLGRRLQDPMLELSTMDTKALALGQTLAEVHQAVLQKGLQQTLASCIATVGIDLNRASRDQLEGVPGFTQELAARVFDARRQRGGFARLTDLAEVPGMDANRLRNVAGFLRVHGGLEPLDATGIHPENYELVGKIAAEQNLLPKDLLGKNLRQVNVQNFTGQGYGRLRTLDVLFSLANAGRDPRGQLEAFRNEGVRTIADLKPDLELRGRVASLTDFGAFVDLGIGQDGLVHVSQIPGSRLRDPERQLRVGEIVTVWVNRVDAAAERISLTMFRPRHLVEARQQNVGEQVARALGRAQRRGGRPEREPQKLMSRAARAPERGRGGRRGDNREGGDAGGRFSRGGREEFSGPREVTVESKKPVAESLGFKGELRSLSSLRALLGGKPKPGDESGTKKD